MSDIILGYVSILVAVVCLGSSFVPLKNIRIGDGVFFQFCMCNALFVTSLPVLLIQNYPPIHGLAFFGGAVWCTGNILCPLAIKFIGIGLGLILWGCTSMLCGWASGTFGLFGLHKQPIKDPMLNIFGVVLSLCSFVVYMQIKTEDNSVDARKFAKTKARNATMESLLSHDQQSPAASVTTADHASYDDELNYEPGHGHELESNVSSLHDSRQLSDSYNAGPTHPLLNMAAAAAPYPQDQPPDVRGRLDSARSDYSVISMKSRSIGDDWPEERKRLVGIVCAIIAGIFFGCSFDPSQYTIDNKYHGHDNSLNYVFPQFVGILLSSWVYTVLYCFYHWYNSTKPYVNAECILPAAISGTIRGLALISWFVANGALGFPITFPIVTAGPGFVGAVWGVCVFQEIKGQRNILTLALAGTVTTIAMTLIALSH